VLKYCCYLVKYCCALRIILELQYAVMEISDVSLCVLGKIVLFLCPVSKYFLVCCVLKHNNHRFS